MLWPVKVRLRYVFEKWAKRRGANVRGVGRPTACARAVGAPTRSATKLKVARIFKTLRQPAQQAVDKSLSWRGVILRRSFFLLQQFEVEDIWTQVSFCTKSWPFGCKTGLAALVRGHLQPFCICGAATKTDICFTTSQPQALLPSKCVVHLRNKSDSLIEQSTTASLIFQTNFLQVILLYFQKKQLPNIAKLNSNLVPHKSSEPYSAKDFERNWKKPNQAVEPQFRKKNVTKMEDIMI